VLKSFPFSCGEPQMRIVASAEHFAAGHDLDQIGSTLMMVADGGHYLDRSVNHRVTKPQDPASPIYPNGVARVTTACRAAQPKAVAVLRRSVDCFR
jgi:hypothetical protein